MRVLITGSNGQLGRAVVKELKHQGHDVIGTDIDEMDITDIADVAEIVSSVNPDIVIHCAAWTDVDSAESNETEVYKVNVDGTRNIIDICAVLDCTLLFISSDYVFEGDGDIPYLENSMCCPKNVYGRSKLDCEELILSSCLEKFFIIRTSWLFGPNGKNFVKTMLRISDMTNRIKVVCDQIGRPTYTPDLSKIISEIITSDRYGIYHVTNEGEYISWSDFARKIFDIAGKPVKIIPVTSDEYKSVAIRPKNSRLNTSKIVENGFTPLPHWEDALKRYLNGDE